MKKLLTLFFLTLLSVTADAVQVCLKFWGNGNYIESDQNVRLQDIPESNGKYTLTLPGSQFRTWGIVDGGRIFFKPWYRSQDGANQFMGCSSANYTASGWGCTFSSSTNGNYDTGNVTLPVDFVARNFTFEISNVSVSNPYTCYVKVSWSDPDPDIVISPIKLKSTLDGWNGTNPVSTSTSGGVTTYTWTWTRSMLEDANIAHGATLNFKLFDEFNKWWGAWKEHSNYDLVGHTADDGWYGTGSDDDHQKDFAITYDRGAEYTIQAKYEDSKWKIKATKTPKPNNPSNIMLMSNFNDYEGLSYDSYSDGIYTWTWTRSALEAAGIANGTLLKFQLLDSSGNWWGAWNGHAGQTDKFNLENYTTTDAKWYEAGTAADHGNKFYVTYERGNAYTIRAKYDSSVSKWDIQVISSYPTYYWVSPQVTNNQKWEYFKMVPSRNRNLNGGDGMISRKYFTFTLKDDDIKKWDDTALASGTKIQWFIVRDDNAYWYRPTDEDKDKDANHASRYYLSELNLTGDFYSYNHTNVGTSNNTGFYFSFIKDAEKSHTFVLNSSPSSSTGNVYIDSPADFADTSKNYYLVGNFTNAKGNVPIDISPESGQEDNWRKLMTKYYYTGSTGTTTYVANPDSIVYVVDVSRPDQGWGDLYVDISPTDNSGNDDERWGKVYRPLMNLFNNLDGRALVGGLTKVGNNQYDKDGVTNYGYQSLNPAPSEFYTSYTFSFNATTMTYNIKFHTSLYLIGPAVSESSSTDGSWNISSSAIRLKSTQDDKHFRNKVYLKNGEGFRFVVKEDNAPSPDYARNFGEDINAPFWASLAESQDHFAGSDTQYKNKLSYNNNGNGNKDQNGNDITFDLPDGYYTINFYDYGENSYYTIEREAELRDYNEVKYKGQPRYILGRGETGTGNHTQRDFTNAYKHFCVWSDYIAWNKPEDVDVYTVTQFNPSGTHTATIQLTKLKDSEDNTKDIKYIPAKKAVILALKTDKDKLKSGMVYDALKGDLSNNTGFNRVIMDMTPYAEPGTTVSSGVSNFKPQYESIVLPYSEGDMYNYLFGFFHANHVVSGNLYDNQDFLLGFWKNNGSGYTYPNSGYLQLSKTDAETLGVGAPGITATEGGTGAPAFLLLFDDEDSSIVTGIRDLDAEVSSVKDSADDHWYTLSGVRITQPTAKGIYIHGGKKVIVR